ncbi:MAG TPA: cupin-like domain-containing protein [Rhizomicrobium sp.]|nr:cupin-like domain-containing protein [Rhizomicrobium sp.]
MPAVAELSGVDTAEQFQREVVEACRPVVLRGLVRDWPVVHASPPQALRDYLGRFDAGGEMDAFLGAPEIAGKYYYGEGSDGFNFERRRMRFGAALQMMLGPADRSLYVGSVPVEEYLPGFAAENPMPLVPSRAAPRIWLGHASNVSSHYDTVDNLACVIAGTRRFTLYGPELIDSLYVGPIDHTMAGQPVSLAASSPDDRKYPRFAAVRDQALTAELLPGDALYIPKLWWHQVEATAPFNGLVNYWWDAFAAGPDAPYTSMLLAMIAIAERPAPERRAWKALFDHYVFREKGHPLAHLPPERHGILGPLKENYGRIRARVMMLLRG